MITDSKARVGPWAGSWAGKSREPFQHHHQHHHHYQFTITTTSSPSRFKRLVGGEGGVREGQSPGL